MSPVKRERESNREIPELFSYVSNSLYKSCQESGKSFYEQHGIRKFGYWLGDSKKTTHQELEELMGIYIAVNLRLDIRKKHPDREEKNTEKTSYRHASMV